MLELLAAARRGVGSTKWQLNWTQKCIWIELMLNLWQSTGCRRQRGLKKVRGGKEGCIQLGWRACAANELCVLLHLALSLSAALAALGQSNHWRWQCGKCQSIKQAISCRNPAIQHVVVGAPKVSCSGKISRQQSVKFPVLKPPPPWHETDSRQSNNGLQIGEQTPWQSLNGRPMPTLRMRNMLGLKLSC